MRPASWSTLGLSAPRMLALSGAAGGAAFGVVVAATLHVLGGLSLVFGLFVGAGAAYALATEPKRSLERSAIRQAQEAPALAAAAAVYLQSSGSRSRTVLMLSSREPRLSSLLERAKGSTLLGMDPTVTLRESRLVVSDSVSTVLSAVGRAQGERLSDEGEESEGMVSSSLAQEQTKFPAFLTVSFFMPIMLMLVAAIGHHDDLVSVVGLAVLEVVILDLVLSFSSAERRRLAQ